VVPNRLLRTYKSKDGNLLDRCSLTSAVLACAHVVDSPFSFIMQASPSCAPSRACLRTGNSLQRAAIKGNKMIKAKVFNSMQFIKEKVQSLETFEQILADRKGYSVETYGKVRKEKTL